jgi:hypothetical protein
LKDVYLSLSFWGQYCFVDSKTPLRKTLKKEPIMTDVRRYTDLRIAQSSRVHARLIERFIEVTEAELASQTDTFVRESLEDLLHTMRNDRRGYGALGGVMPVSEAA